MEAIITRALHGEATPEELERIAVWRRESPRNEREYRELEAVWRLSGGLEAVGSVGGAPAARELAARAEAGRPAVLGLPSRSRPRPGTGRLALAVAASLLLALALPQLAARLRGGAGRAAVEYATGARELATVRLDDGTVVRLGPRSLLRFHQDEARREAWLEGHAFFAVAKDAGRPFVVRTRAGEAAVLGTRFEVMADSGEVRVLVVEGRVALSAGGGEVRLGAGEMSRAHEGSNPTSVEKVDDVAGRLDWMGRFLVFESTPLTQVAREVERRYGVRVEVADSALGERTVSAIFTDQTPEGVLAVVCAVVDARCSGRGGVTIVEP